MPRGRKPAPFNKKRIYYRSVNIPNAIFERLDQKANTQNRSISSIVQDGLIHYFKSIGTELDEILPLPLSAKRSLLYNLNSLEQLAKRNGGFYLTLKEIDDLKYRMFIQLINHGWELKDNEYIQSERWPKEIIDATIIQLKVLGSWPFALSRTSFNGHRTDEKAIIRLWDTFQLTPLHRYPKILWSHNGSYPQPKKESMPQVKAPTVEPQLELIPKTEDEIVSIAEPSVEKVWTDSRLPNEN